jgi:uncharacterized protein (TIGR03437 family)
MRFRFLSLLGFGTAAVLAQPAIDPDGISNNASYLSSVLPNSGIAQGSIFAVFGRGLGPATIQSATTFPLPTTLAGTQVRVTVGGTTVNAIVLYTLATQVGAILPSNTPAGTGTLQVVYNGLASATAPIRVVPSAFGIFTINQAGSGPAVVTDPNFRVNLITDVFRPGDVAIVWGTGLGPVSGPEAERPLPGDLPVNVQVLVGGRPAEVLGKSRSGCCAGLDQIAFRIPADVEGCYVPLVVRAGNVLSNYTSMSIARSGRVCSDPNGFSANDLERIQGGGTYSFGAATLTRSTIKFSIPQFLVEAQPLPGQLPPPGSTVEIKSDNGGGVFYRWDFNRLIRSQSAGGGLAPIGQCYVSVYRGTSSSDPIRPDPLDAGPVLNLSGPRGTKQLTRTSAGVYSAQLGGGNFPGVPGGQPDYLEPGSYTLNNGSGGADVGPFQKTIEVPTLLTWSNQDSITNVNRGQGLRITWTGGNPNTEMVYISGTSFVQSPQVGASFICTERVSAGQFTVPAEVLSVLPPSPVLAGGVPGGVLSVGSLPVIGDSFRFTARGLDVGTFTYYVFHSKQVNYQ